MTSRNDEAAKCCQNLDTLERERDLLESALFALTTHFAQVQFRLRQVADAPAEEQDDLLKSLQEFAFKGIANNDNLFTHAGDSMELIEAIRTRRTAQNQLLKQLRTEVRQLGRFNCDSKTNEIDELVNDLKVKESLEGQLRTQIADLERFIAYLKNRNGKCCCDGKVHAKPLKIQVMGFIEQISSFLHMFAFLHFGGRAMEKSTSTSNHWGDLRARLELTIINLKQLLRSNSPSKNITLIVRNNLARDIKELMEHGAKSAPSHLLVPLIECFQYAGANSTKMHAWDIILEFYRLKNGDEFNSETGRKLSQSFNLNEGRNGDKRNVLCVIGGIIATHTKLKRSSDSHFRAFICAGLNANRLSSWLGLVFRCGAIVRERYHSWSFVASRGYADGLRSLEILDGFKFDLPVDLDVQRFQINDCIN